jgi:HEAT repeat protein
VRAGAIRLLGMHGGASEMLRERLRPFLEDPAPGPRLAAMDALSRLGDTRSIAAFVRMGSRDGIDAELIQALARFTTPDGHGGLATAEAYATLAGLAASDETQPVARSLAVQTLARSDDERARPYLESLRLSTDVRVRRLAEAGLARLDQTR